MAYIALIRRSVSTAIIAKPLSLLGLRQLSAYFVNHVMVEGRINRYSPLFRFLFLEKEQCCRHAIHETPNGC